MSPAVSNCVSSCPACWMSLIFFQTVSHLSLPDDISQVLQIWKEEMPGQLCGKIVSDISVCVSVSFSFNWASVSPFNTPSLPPRTEAEKGLRNFISALQIELTMKVLYDRYKRIDAPKRFKHKTMEHKFKTTCSKITFSNDSSVGNIRRSLVFLTHWSKCASYLTMY